MAETIESFVARLQSEGVQAGQEEARIIVDHAKREADGILAAARASAQQIIKDAQAQAQNTLARSQTELELATRDALLMLKAALTAALGAVLAKAAQVQLGQSDFMRDLLRELVLQYAKADIGQQTLKINVPPSLSQQAMNWGLHELAQQHGSGLSVELASSLSKAGFEYSIHNATVEVTLDSVVELLRDMVSPALDAVIEKAMAERKT